MKRKSRCAKLPERSLARRGPPQAVTWEPPLWRRFVAALVLVVLAATVCGQSTSAQDHAHCHTLPPKILVLRGVFEVFSLGMNDLAEKLACRGYDVTLTSWSLALHETICTDQQPYVIIGHSLGGRMCGWVPRKLKKCGKRVPLVIIVDANLMKPIPSNVDRCLNLYVTNPFGIFHGSPVRGESPCTEIINWDVSQGQPSCIRGGVNHFDIDATPWVHQIIIDELEDHFPSPLSLALMDTSAGGSQLASDLPSEHTSPIPQEIQSLTRTRSVPWSPSRTENPAREQAQPAPLLSWRPDRAEAGSHHNTR